MHNIELQNRPKKTFFQTKFFKLFYSRVIPILVILLVFVLAGMHFLSRNENSSIASPLNIIFNTGPKINSTDGKVNVLLLGNAGGLHDGALLTDTIMVASLNFRTNKVYLISLPRDLWVEEVKGKINSVYERGGDEGEGLSLSKKVTGEILGIPIHYAIRVDFNGFIKAVDEVGGIDIEVAKTFDDHLYPIAGKEDDLCEFTEQEKEFNEEEAKSLNIEPGKRKILIAPDGKIATDSGEAEKGYEYFKCRYEHISFKKGSSHLDGETSLKFVRSRMGTNGEGSDFARSSRQQKVLDALKSKILSLGTLANPSKVTALIGIFGDSIETDFQIDDILEIYNLTKKIESSASVVLSNSGKNPLLKNPPIGEYGAWVLVPKADNYEEIHNYINKVLAGEEMDNDEATSSSRARNN